MKNIILSVTLALGSCGIPYKNYINQFDRHLFSQIEIRSGEGFNQACVLVLNSEGLIIRESKETFSAKNRYYFVPMPDLDSSAVNEIQNLVEFHNFLSGFKECYCSEGSGLVPKKITFVTSPNTNFTSIVFDSNYLRENRNEDEIILDKIRSLMLKLIPESYRGPGFCW
ncbi:MAG: hypothetical protein RIR61_628 [Bacteroidota bacterium]|jgi:hypothetical protein